MPDVDDLAASLGTAIINNSESFTRPGSSHNTPSRDSASTSNGIPSTPSTAPIDPTAPIPPTAGPTPAPTNPSALSTLLSDLNRHPLFMTTLDETDGSGGSNASLDALKALAYEGTKAEVAENFRQQGNDCARAKRWGDAREFYGKALGVLAGKAKGEDKEDGKGKGQEPTLKEKLEGDVGPREVDWLDSRTGDEGSKVIDLEEEARKERSIEEACAVNRALCNLELKNYAQTTRDSLHALRLNPRNSKAYYRSAAALLALDKTDLARRTADLGLPLLPATDPAHASFIALLKRIDARSAALHKAEAERETRRLKEAQEKATLVTALKKRKMAVTSNTSGEKPDLEDAVIGLADPTDADSELHFPVLVLYPTASRSELVKSVSESSTVGELVGTVLPLPWERGGEFGGEDGKGVGVFVETGAGGLRKIGLRVAWGSVLEGGGCRVQDGLCRVMLVPTGRVDAWIREWKVMNGKA